MTIVRQADSEFAPAVRRGAAPREVSATVALRGLVEPALAPAPAPQLSPRMLTCLEWASHGKSSVDIGQLLGISPRTVDDYLTECRRRLGVRTRVQAVIKALILGLI